MRWDPTEYLGFADERARPFSDLLARVGARDPRAVVDLGCGPGNLTLDLARRWPGAAVEGLDSSPEMIGRARAARPADGPGSAVRFEVGDVRGWAPSGPVDVVVCNATLHWVPGHLALLPRWAAALAPGGWLALQVPANFGEPSHTTIAELREEPRWRDRLGGAAVERPAVAEPAAYLEALATAPGVGLDVDVWETTYLQVLDGEDAVLRWVRGTALRPVLSALDADDAAAFEAEYAARVREAYPRRPFGTVLPYRRIFAVARRRG